MDQFGMTQEGIAQIVGRSRSAVANSLRLLQLPEQIQQYLQEGAITTGHAKALAALRMRKPCLHALHGRRTVS